MTSAHRNGSLQSTAGPASALRKFLLSNDTNTSPYISSQEVALKGRHGCPESLLPPNYNPEDDTVSSHDAPSLTFCSSNSTASSVVDQNYQVSPEMVDGLGFEMDLAARPRHMHCIRKSKLSMPALTNSEDQGSPAHLNSFDKCTAKVYQTDQSDTLCTEHKKNIAADACSSISSQNTSHAGQEKIINRVDEASDSEGSEDQDGYSTEDDDEDDNEWSGKDDNVEAMILQAVDYDYTLAAYLITELPQVLDQQRYTKASRNIGLWCNSITKCADGSSASTPEKSDPSDGNTSRSEGDRKRTHIHRSRGNLDAEEIEEDEDEDGREPKRFKNVPIDNDIATLRLACPFYKVSPSGYSVQPDSGKVGKRTRSRACSGPGYKSIQHLKEHLKRVHTPAQCDRCYYIAGSSAELVDHRRLPEPCQKKSESLKEGISNAQWDEIDKKTHKKKGKGAFSDVEKWNEIWRVLFSDSVPMPHPWFEIPRSNLPPSTHSHGRTADFLGLFSIMLGHQEANGDLPLEPEVRRKVLDIGCKAYNLTWSISPQCEESTSLVTTATTGNYLSSSRLGTSFQIIPSSAGATSYGNPREAESPIRNRKRHANSRRISQQNQDSPPCSAPHTKEFVHNHPANGMLFMPQPHQQPSFHQTSMNLVPLPDNHHNQSGFSNDFVDLDPHHFDSTRFGDDTMAVSTGQWLSNLSYVDPSNRVFEDGQATNSPSGLNGTNVPDMLESSWEQFPSPSFQQFRQ